MTQQVPPGWYPDPQLPERFRWYDGTRWTEHTGGSAAGARHQGRPHLGDGWFQLARALQFFLALVVIADVWALALNQSVLRLVTDLRNDVDVDLRRIDGMDRQAEVLTIIGWVLSLAILVLFIAWLFQAHRSDAMDTAELNHRSGWAIGGWFVPVLNLWRPYQMVQEVHRASSPRAEESRLILAWWVTLILSRVMFSLAGPGDPGPAAAVQRNLLQLQHGLETVRIGGVLELLAGVFAIIVVRRITGAVRRAYAEADLPSSTATWG